VADKFILLLEGKDDEHVFYHLLQHHKVPERFKIKNKNGVEKLLEELDVELLGSGLQSLGIVVDADLNLKRRWNELKHKLSQSGYTHLPVNPTQGGTIIEQENKPTVGVWLMPDNVIPGMLEDFIGLLVSPEDALWPIAMTCTDQVMQIERRFPKGHRSKAIIHTWLAWQKVPGTPFGSAINEKFLDADAPHAQELIAWIRRLFGI
jgi:hypothetical protein